MRKFFLTLGYSGLSPYTPGTVGSFVALVLGYILLQYGILPQTLFMLAILIGTLAISQIDKYQEEHNTLDPKEIVIDELVGMWIALSMCNENIMMAVLAFLGFRLFDITKPSIIGVVDRKFKDGKGVVLDDALAGLFGGLLAMLVYKIIQILQ